MRKNSFYFIMLMLSMPLYAADLGVYGRVWDIQEVDIRKLITLQLSAKSLTKFYQQLINSPIYKYETFRAIDFKQANITKTLYFDPAFTLQHDIVIKKLLFHKGMKINPLHYLKPVTKMLFIDGTDSLQRDFALKALSQFPFKLLIVITRGDFSKLSHYFRRPIYFAYQDIVKRFHISHLPSLVSTGTNEHLEEIAVIEFSFPYQLNELIRCWQGC